MEKWQGSKTLRVSRETAVADSDHLEGTSLAGTTPNLSESPLGLMICGDFLFGGDEFVDDL